MKLAKGVSGDEENFGRVRLKWRNRIQQPDGRIKTKQRSTTVDSEAEARAMAVHIAAELKEHGFYEVGVGPFRLADEDLEEVLLAYLKHKRVFNRRAQNTLDNIGRSFSRFVRGLRLLLGLTEDDMIPARMLSLDLYQDWVGWAATIGNRNATPYGVGTVYQSAFTVLDAWTWAADQTTRGSKRWPTLPNPPYNSSAHLPPRPAYEAPTDVANWRELDAVVNRVETLLDPSRASNVYVAFWCCVIERYTGLRLFQAVGIHRDDVDEEGCTLLVRRGKSEREKKLNRRMAVCPHLWRDLRPLLDAVASGPLFPDSKRPQEPVRHYRNTTIYATAGWERAIAAGMARPTVLNPPDRDKGSPNHAFRGGIMQALEDVDVRASVIDWLVGHAPVGTRAKHYTKASLKAQRTAVAHIPAIVWEDREFPRRFGLYKPAVELPAPQLDLTRWSNAWTPIAAIS